jgi:RNase P subunit RPR2
MLAQHSGDKGIRILLLDIETAPSLAYIWDARTDYVTVDKVTAPGYTLCWSAKWLGEKDMMFDSVHESSQKKMLSGIHRLMDEADAIVTYNGLKFDIPTLNREYIKNGMSPPSPSRQIDLYPVVKKEFKFFSNKLDWVAKELGVGAKLQHKGMELWKECMAGKESAWSVMTRYNKNDVTLLEKVYIKVRPWIRNHPNVGVYSDERRPMCKNCGGHVMQSRGRVATETQIFRKYQCQKCGAWTRSAMGQLDREKRSMIMRRIT